MDDVGNWEPNAPPLSDVHREVLDVAIKALSRPQLGLSAEQQDSIRQAVRCIGGVLDGFCAIAIVLGGRELD